MLHANSFLFFCLLFSLFYLFICFFSMFCFNKMDFGMSVCHADVCVCVYAL